MTQGRITLPERHRVAVMSDVHANAHAFKAAIALARLRGFDHLIVLGDLLTYGGEPREVLDLAAELVARDGTILVKGNHDQLYADLAIGREEYYACLPEWLRESIDWTRRKLDGRNLDALFPWAEAIECGEILFAHANPFAFGNWTYLNKPVDFAAAAAALRTRGKCVGVFGHTHRAKLVVVPAEGEPTITIPGGDTSFPVTPLPADAIALLDAGSIGQPRDDSKKSMMLFLERRNGYLAAEFSPIDYDVEPAVRALEAMPLSEATKKRLFRYFQ